MRITLSKALWACAIVGWTLLLSGIGFIAVKHNFTAIWFLVISFVGSIVEARAKHSE
jgi:hypothetical protein